MATKTISIDLEAYDRLSRARRHPRESFSQVIRRAEWKTSPVTGQALLDFFRDAAVPDERIPDVLDANQRLDAPPEDEWDR